MKRIGVPAGDFKGRILPVTLYTQFSVILPHTYKFIAKRDYFPKFGKKIGIGKK